METCSQKFEMHQIHPSCRLRPLSDSSIRMTADLYAENSRVHRLLSGVEEMRFVF